METPSENKQASKTAGRVFRWSKRRELLVITLVATAIVMLGAMIGVFVVTSRLTDETQPSTEISENQVSLAARDIVRLTVGDESYDVSVRTSMTVEELMDTALELRPNDGAGPAFTYEKEITSLGALVTQVGALPQQEDESLFWTYRLNGENATLGISDQNVIPGDVIEWRRVGPDAF